MKIVGWTEWDDPRYRELFPIQKLKATNIIWDTDGEDVSLPNEIEIPEGMVNEDEISVFLSDETGFCHFGFELESI